MTITTDRPAAGSTTPTTIPDDIPRIPSFTVAARLRGRWAVDPDRAEIYVSDQLDPADARQAMGEAFAAYVTHQPTPPAHQPPIVCAPWCIDGDGHPNTLAREDQLCISVDHDAFGDDGTVTAYLRRKPDQRTTVMIWLTDEAREIDVEVALSPEVARALHSGLGDLLGVAETAAQD